MTIAFGTDGWRAVISDTFTFENVRLLAQAIADYVREQSERDQSEVVIGYDTRFLSDRYPDFFVRQALSDAAITGSEIKMTADPFEAVSGADVVYTDTWTSMGQEDEKQKRAAIFAPYQVNADLMSHAKKDAIFMHCLPAYRGYEVTADIIDSPRSVVFDEAENRLHAHKAILVHCLLR